MYWRGPDFAFSRIWEGRLFLGQTVLSITGDPRGMQGKHQCSSSQRYQILYNGEIYNFRDLEQRFLQAHSESPSRYGTDTEVLTNLHEVLSPAEIPPQLDGMYAYVVLDTLARQLQVARDIQGEKSLYIYEDEQWVVIASEIRAILTLVPNIALDPQALRDYFRTRHLILFERTVYQRIRQLLPGHTETLNLDTFQWSTTQTLCWRDWINPQRLLDNSHRSLDSLTDELDSLLTRCVREMIPPNRRYAAIVSGGVDSSLVAHYLTTMGHPDLLIAVNHVGKDLISANLSGFERHLGQPIHQVGVDPAAYAAEIWRCQQVCGAPLHSHSFVGQALQSAVVRHSGCRILFGGDGADELFGGYPAYLESTPANGRFSPSPYTTHEVPRVEFWEDAPHKLQEDLAKAWASALEAYGTIEEPQARTRLAMMYCDARYQLPEVGLRGADLMSMMWSIETRSVYLRRPIVEFALHLPATMKANAETTCPPLLRAKRLLKHLFLRYFPAHLLVEKQGFAGFPNESAAYLGDPHDYRAVSLLTVRPDSLSSAWTNRATAWKLINTEYFLRTHVRT